MEIYERIHHTPKRISQKHVIIKRRRKKRIVMIPLKFQDNTEGVMEAHSSKKVPRMAFIRIR